MIQRDALSCTGQKKYSTWEDHRGARLVRGPAHLPPPASRSLSLGLSEHWKQRPEPWLISSLHHLKSDVTGPGPRLPRPRPA